MLRVMFKSYKMRKNSLSIKALVLALYLLFLQYFATLSVTSPSSHKKLESSLVCCKLYIVFNSGGSCLWLQSCSSPTRFCDLFFFEFFIMLIFFIIVHNLFTNAPAYVATKTNFPILLALN